MLFLWENGGKEPCVTDLIYMLAVLRPYSALMSVDMWLEIDNCVQTISSGAP